jgi:hypothetical protein
VFENGLAEVVLFDTVCIELFAVRYADSPVSNKGPANISKK